MIGALARLGISFTNYSYGLGTVGSNCNTSSPISQFLYRVHLLPTKMFVRINTQIRISFDEVCVLKTISR